MEKRIDWSTKRSKTIIVSVVLIVAVASIAMIAAINSENFQGLDSKVGLEFTSGDFGYIITNDSDRTVELVSCTMMSSDLTIPSDVIFENTKYSVVSIADNLFASKILDSVVIPETIEHIGKNAFALTRLTELTLPSSLKTVGEGAFANNSQLISLEILGIDTVLGPSAFAHCGKLTNLTIPISVDAVGPDKSSPVFDGCDNLKRFMFTPGGGNSVDYSSTTEEDFYYGDTPWASNVEFMTFEMEEGITKIGDNMFRGCILATSVDIPSTVVEIGDSAFRDCTALERVHFGRSLVHIGDYAFQGCVSLASFSLPSSVDTVGCSTFEGCVSIQQLHMHDGLKTIDSYAFKGCVNIRSINLPFTLVSIGNNAFENCSSLTSVIVPSGVTVIQAETFKNCYALEKAYFSEKTTSIERGAFVGCGSLSSVVIPDSVKSLGPSAFYGCISLTNLTLPISLDSVADNNSPAFSGSEYITNIVFTVGTGEGFDYSLSALGETGCYKFTPWHFLKKNPEVVFEKGITHLGDYTFYECYGYKERPEDDSPVSSPIGGVKEIVLPDTLISIGNNAFANSKSITTVVIPDSVRSIGKAAFNGAVDLKSLSIGNGLQDVAADAFGGIIFYEKDGKTRITDWAGLRGFTFTGEYIKMIKI